MSQDHKSRKVNLVFANSGEGVDPSLSTYSTFRLEFRNPVEGLSFVQTFRRWAIQEVRDYRLVGVSIKSDGSNVYKNYETFIESTLDVARRLKEVGILGEGVRALAKSSDYYVTKVQKKSPKTIKYSDLFGPKVMDPRYRSNVIFRTNVADRLDMKFLFSNLNHEDQRVLKVDNEEFYVLNQHSGAVKRFNYLQDLGQESVYYVNLETFQYMDHRLIYGDFINYLGSLSEEFKDVEIEKFQSYTKLSGIGMSSLTLEYLMSLNIFTVGDLLENVDKLDMGRVSDDSQELISYILSNKF